MPGVGARPPLLEAARARDLPLVLAYGEAAACVMAAVTGDLAGAPGAAFGAHGEGYLRISYASSEANLARALERMRPLFESWAR